MHSTTVGDVLALLSLVKTTYDNYTDSRSVCLEVKADLDILLSTLEDVDIAIKQADEGSVLAEKVSTVLTRTHIIIKELEKYLEHYIKKPDNIFDRASLASRRMLFNEDKIQRFHRRIKLNLLELSVVTSSSALRATERLVKAQKHHEILNWLDERGCPPRPSVPHLELQEGIVSWFHDTTEFKEWLEEPGRTLICDGKPGAGKTTLLAETLTMLERKAEKEYGARAFIFFQQHNRDQQRLQDVLRIFVLQLCKAAESLPDPSASEELEKLFKKCRSEYSPSADDLMKVLQSMVKKFPRIYFVLDAMDECSDTDNIRDHLLRYLRTLQLEAGAGVSILVSSRHDHPHRSLFNKLGEPAFLRISARDDDIRSYVNNQLESSSEPIIENICKEGSRLPEEIVQLLITSSSGMFLIAKLGIRMLLAQLKISELKSAMHKVKAGLADPYDQMYDLNIQRIQHHRERALSILARLVVSKRALSIRELQESLVMNDEPEIMDFDESDFIPVKNILNICVGLIVVDEASQSVSLVHSTLRGYVQRKHIDLVERGHIQFASTCLRYLRLERFSGIHNPAEIQSGNIGQIVPARNEKYKFLRYAATYWASHFKSTTTTGNTRSHNGSESDLESLALAFLGSSTLVDSACRAMYFPEIFFTEKSRENMTGLHLASLFGVDSLVEKILDSGHSINARNARGQTPLHMAAMAYMLGGQTSVARILLASPGIHPDARDAEGYTPLYVATALGAIGIVSQLAVRTDVDVNTVDKVIPGPPITLIPTGIPGYSVALDDVVQLLMEKIRAARVAAGPDKGNVMEPSSTSTVSNTATTGLQLPPVNEKPSSENDLLVSVRLKVSGSRATPSYQDRLRISSLSRPHGRTALHYAARNGNTDIAKLLLNNPSIQIDIKDGHGMTPLHKAAKYGHLSIVKLLMDRDGVTGWEHSTEKTGRLPIHLAVKYGHMHIVAFFISQDKELVNATDNEGNTILHHSIYVNPTAVVEGILKYDNVMPDVRDKCGKTPLWKAIEINNIPVVSILQHLSDVNQDPTDNEGRRPNEARSEEKQQVPLPPTNNTEMPLEQLDSPENLAIG